MNQKMIHNDYSLRDDYVNLISIETNALENDIEMRGNCLSINCLSEKF